MSTVAITLDNWKRAGIELVLADENQLETEKARNFWVRESCMRQQALRWLVGAGGIFSAFLCSSLCLSAWGEEPAHVNGPAASEVAQWVKQLDDESYAVRETALKNLVSAGASAVDPLTQAVLSESAEVAWRATTALSRIATQGDEATLERVSDALSKVSSKRPAVASLAREVKDQAHKYRHKRALGKIRGLGGKVSGHWSDRELAAAMPVGEADVAAAAFADLPVAPAIAFEEAPLDVPVIEEPEVRAAPRGLLGLLARLIVPEVRAVPVPLDDPFGPADPIPEAPEAEPVPPPAEIAIADPLPIHPLERAEKEAAELPRFEVPELSDRPRFEAPRAVEFAPGEAVLIPRAPLIEEEAVPAPMVVEVIEADEPLAVELAAIDVGFAGPIMVGDDFAAEEGGEDYAELILDKSFRGTDADLALLKDIPEIYNLKINGAKLTDKALEHIAALPRLTSLELIGTEMTSTALQQLRKKRPELSIICRSSAMLGINAGLEGPCVMTSVFYGSGAYEAGLKAGDEIVEVDGQTVRDFSDLTIAVYPHKAGDKLAVKFVRGEKTQEVQVTLKPRAGQ